MTYFLVLAYRAVCVCDKTGPYDIPYHYLV